MINPNWLEHHQSVDLVKDKICPMKNQAVELLTGER